MYKVNTPQGEIAFETKKELKAFKAGYPIIMAGGGLLINNAGDFLFIFRRGYWDLPKGKQDRHEGIRRTAIREVQEETGLEPVSIIRKLSVTYHIYFYKGRDVIKETHWYIMHYMGSALAVPQADEDITKAVWLDRKEVEKIMPETYPNIRTLMEDFFTESGTR